MSKSKIFLYFSLSFISGISINSIVAIPQYLMLGFLILGIILILISFKQKNFFVVGFCLIFLVLGIWRYQITESEIRDSELKKYNGLEQNVLFTGTVVKEPDIREKHIKLTVEPEKLKRQGRILVTISRYPEYKYGDKLKIIGKLEAPPVFEDFNYKNYLEKEGIYSVVYYPKIEHLNKENSRNPVSNVYRGILAFKNKLRESIYGSLSSPQSSILGAMILGDKSRMSNDLKEKLNIAGVRHITAVSGMHVVILSSILMSLLLALGFWRGQAFYFSIILIFLFIIITGLQPSGIRAGIIGGLFLLGQKIGRKSVSSQAIVMAASLMLVINPLLLLNDVGFQLSFLAAMGIIYLAPIFKNWLSFIPKKFDNLKEIIAMTFAAQVFTLPILIYNFGKISLAAPLTNVLIIPIVYWIMIFGFIFALAGIIYPVLGWLLSFPCLFLLTYLTKIVDFFSQPWAAKTIENVHWLWLIIFYLILAVFTYWLNRKERLKFLQY